MLIIEPNPSPQTTNAMENDAAISWYSLGTTFGINLKATLLKYPMDTENTVINLIYHHSDSNTTFVVLFEGATLQYMKSGINTIRKTDMTRIMNCPALVGFGHFSLVATSLPR